MVRLNLSSEPEGKFDLLLIDAFSSDSVPAHLLTVEAVDLYLSRVSETGFLVMHISNRHMDLSQIVARVADQLQAPVLYQFYIPPEELDGEFAESASQVVVLASTAEALSTLRNDPRWTALQSDGKRPWTDDYSNVIGAIWAKYN